MTDITARQLQTKISDLWGQPVIVDNRAGASGNIALELAARSAPDGYTLFVGNVSTNAINETTFKSLKVKPSRDLTGVKIMLSPEMKASLSKVFMSVVVNKSPEEFQQFVLKEIKDWGKIVVENNIKVE
ncbi:MAG: hypothetical protein A2W68_07090 [Betaproteobacteria bacterium RIFCSPLOWO2_02_64_14]|nr:MAG: hypothetical protein A2W68_07090 [Betaproteobacteria bacterium RIFCSPLOWO2_02_64_14]